MYLNIELCHSNLSQNFNNCSNWANTKNIETFWFISLMGYSLLQIIQTLVQNFTLIYFFLLSTPYISEGLCMLVWSRDVDIKLIKCWYDNLVCLQLLSIITNQGDIIETWHDIWSQNPSVCLFMCLSVPLITFYLCGLETPGWKEYSRKKT